MQAFLRYNELLNAIIIMTYTLPELPYANNALAPSISRETIEYHYGKHERTYIDNLNRLIKDTPCLLYTSDAADD